MNINNIKGVWRLKRIYKLLNFELLPYPPIVKCNICNWSGRRFLDNKWLKRIQCPNCTSDYRHRLLFESLKKLIYLINIYQIKKLFTLHQKSFLCPIFAINRNMLQQIMTKQMLI